MILISFPLALIAIVFGAKLLAQSQKDNLGALYKFVSWFVIVMGFLILLCDGAHALMRCCNMHHDMMMQKECMMMNRGGDDQCMMGSDGQMMMHCNRGNMCCDGHDGMMKCDDNGGKCSDGKMNCNDDGKGASCTEGGMKSGSCPMMDKMKCKSDSGKSKK